MADESHRILPNRPAASRPLHALDKLYLWLLFGLFLVFAFLLLFSRLLPTQLTGRDIVQAAGTHVNVSNGTYFTCDYALVEGTHLVSFPCIPPAFTLTTFFQNLSENGSGVGAMYRYAPSRIGKWQVYNGSLPNYTVQTLSSFERYNGVYIVMTAEERFSYFGALTSRETVSLSNGWNLIGYPYNGTRPLAEAIATLNDTYLMVETLEGLEESGTYLTDTPPPGGETLDEFAVYHGYWVRLNRSDTWVIVR